MNEQTTYESINFVNKENVIYIHFYEVLLNFNESPAAMRVISKEQ
jgi:hypothetical protein